MSPPPYIPPPIWVVPKVLCKYNLEGDGGPHGVHNTLTASGNKTKIEHSFRTVKSGLKTSQFSTIRTSLKQNFRSCIICAINISGITVLYSYF